MHSGGSSRVTELPLAFQGKRYTHGKLCKQLMSSSSGSPAALKKVRILYKSQIITPDLLTLYRAQERSRVLPLEIPRQRHLWDTELASIFRDQGDLKNTILCHQIETENLRKREREREPRSTSEKADNLYQRQHRVSGRVQKLGGWEDGSVDKSALLLLQRGCVQCSL